jgi:solute carrier family 25 carnitine/acylcarnitine transporter 20/29
MSADPNSAQQPVFWKDFVAGYISGLANIMSGQPFDICKIRMQSQGTGSLGSTFTSIVKNEGIMSLWKGSLFPLIGFGLCNSVVFAVNEKSKFFFREKSDSNRLSFWQFYVSGGLSGVANSFISAPMEHIRIRMQIQTNTFKLYNGSIDCFTKILQQYGIKGLYKGMGLTVVREFFLYGAYFGAYEALKQWGNRNDSLFLMTIGGIGGMSGWVGGCLIDNLKSKVQTDSFENPKYRNFADLRKVMTFGEMTKGFSAGFIRAFPVNAITFYTFELAMRGLYSTRK